MRRFCSSVGIIRFDSIFLNVLRGKAHNTSDFSYHYEGINFEDQDIGDDALTIPNDTFDIVDHGQMMDDRKKKNNIYIFTKISLD